MLSGNTLSQIIPFLVAPILARIFSPVDFAVVANFMAIVGVIGIVATGRLELAIPLPKDHSKAQEIVFTGLMITFLLGGLSLLIPLFSEQIGELYKDKILSDFLWLVPLSVVSFGLLGLANNWSLRYEKFQTISIGKIGQSLVNNGLAAIFGYIGWGINGLIIAWLLSQYVNIFILLIGVKTKVKREDFGIITIKSTLKEYKDFPLINSIHAFTDIFVTQFLLFWLISTYFGYFELGLFAMMNKYVRAPIVLISSSVSQLFYIEAGKAINNGTSLVPILTKTIKTSVLFAIPFILILFFFGPIIFKWYLGDQWEQAGAYAQSITPMLFLSFIVSPISGLPIILNKQRGAFLFSLFGYSISLLTMLIALYYNLDFKISLWFYSGAFCVYYLLVLLWYFKLIMKNNEGVK
jgi:O-antigen/teichoic acid export membrane protein